MKYDVRLSVTGWYWDVIEAPSKDEAAEIALKNLIQAVESGMPIRLLDDLDYDLDPEVYKHDGDDPF